MRERSDFSIVLFHNLQTEIDDDFLTIYDEVNDYYNPIKILSGYLGSFGVSSNGNVMYLKFESSVEINENGFLAKFYYGIKIYSNSNLKIYLMMFRKILFLII